ncbi:hypothetical protein M0804_004726 [Polistes exclamans]|nr:hypothetical protein M0804_004726 [Polistes exclamans]
MTLNVVKHEKVDTNFIGRPIVLSTCWVVLQALAQEVSAYGLNSLRTSTSDKKLRHLNGSGLLIIVEFATILVTVLAGDKPILPIPTECPVEDSPDYTVLLKHESDCTKFYMCLQGEKILMDCPFLNKAKTRRLHFNALLQVCDFPFKANCSGGSTPPTPTVPIGDKTCQNSPVGTLVAHENRCHLYYKCTDYGKDLLECPRGTTFNPDRGVCDSTNSCRLTNVCRNHRDSEGEFYPHPTSCKKVYYCMSNSEMIYECDENAEWNAEAGKCMRSDLANCKRRLDYYKQ